MIYIYDMYIISYIIYDKTIKIALIIIIIIIIIILLLVLSLLS